jgi:hypothetical protein
LRGVFSDGLPVAIEVSYYYRIGTFTTLLALGGGFETVGIDLQFRFVAMCTEANWSVFVKANYFPISKLVS